MDLGHQEALDHQDGELRVPEEAGGQHAQEAGGGHREAGCLHQVLRPHCIPVNRKI